MKPNTEPLVSVVIAAYNCEQYIAGAVESVLAQTYPTLELHVVNDGSTDGTASVLGRYSGDPRVHCHEQPHAGQTSAKNRGIAAARGEFVAFCDADDLWLPSKLALQIPCFQRGDRIGVVYSRSAPIGPDGRRLQEDPPRRLPASGRITEALFTSNIIPFGTAVVRRACLADMGGFNERYRMGIDWELWLRLSTRYEFWFVDELTYLHRIWPGQMSKNWVGRYEAAFEIMDAFLERHPDAVRPSVVRAARADSFVMRARIRALQSHQYGRALIDLVRALQLTPASGIAWKSVAYVLVTAAGSRRP